MLHVAAYKGRNDVISYLLGIGADPNILDVVSISISCNILWIILVHAFILSIHDKYNTKYNRQ